MPLTSEAYSYFQGWEFGFPVRVRKNHGERSRKKNVYRQKKEITRQP